MIRLVGVLTVAVLVACSADRTLSSGRVEGDVFGTLEDRSTHRFTGMPLTLISADTAAPAKIKREVCAPYWSTIAKWRDRVYASGGDLMSLQLDLEAARFRLAEVRGTAKASDARELSARRERSDSVKDALEQLRVESLSKAEAILQQSAKARTSTDVNGHFIFDSVPPGAYRIVALASLGDSGLALPSAIRKYGLPQPNIDDWVWMVPVNVAPAKISRADLSSQNRALFRARLQAICESADSALKH